MSFRKTTIQVILLLLPGLWGPVKADLIEVVTFAYEPYMFNDERGLALEILTSALKSRGHSVKLSHFPRKRAILNYKNGQGDLFVGVRGYFESDSISSQEIFFYRRGLIHTHRNNHNNALDPMEAIKGKNVAIRLGSSKISAFKAAGAALTQVPDSTNGLEMLQRGRVDYLYVLDLEALYILQQMVPDRLEDFQFIELESSTGDVIQRTNFKGKDYLDEFRRGLNSIIDQGIYREIFESYYGRGKVPESVMLPRSRH